MEMLINRDASLAMIENDDGETALDMLRRRSRGASSRAENTVNRRTASVERLQEGAATASFLLECAEGDEGREKWSLAEGGEGEEGSVRQESGGGRQESGGEAQPRRLHMVAAAHQHTSPLVSLRSTTSTTTTVGGGH